MKKRILILGLILSLMATMVACGDKNDAKDQSAQTTETVETVKEDESSQEEVADHGHGEYEWIGEFELNKGVYLLHFGESPDETMDVGFIKLGDNVADLEHHAEHLMAVEEKEIVSQDSEFEAKPDFLYTIEMDPEHGHVHFEISEDGTYALVTEHHPSENNLQVFGEDDIEIMPVKEYEGSHGHDH